MAKRLTKQHKAERTRQRMLDKAREYQLGTYSRKFVAPVFQQMIRAEAASEPAGETLAVVNAEIRGVFRKIGQCVCITCGKVAPWKGNSIGGGEIETGHFIASRRMSILFEETNVAPQCKYCNRHLGGNQGCYEQWMLFVYGQDEIDRLRKLKNETVQFTREELVDKRLFYKQRLDLAVDYMKE